MGLRVLGAGAEVSVLAVELLLMWFALLTSVKVGVPELSPLLAQRWSKERRACGGA